MLHRVPPFSGSLCLLGCGHWWQCQTWCPHPQERCYTPLVHSCHRPGHVLRSCPRLTQWGRTRGPADERYLPHRRQTTSICHTTRPRSAGQAKQKKIPRLGDKIEGTWSLKEKVVSGGICSWGETVVSLGTSLSLVFSVTTYTQYLHKRNSINMIYVFSFSFHFLPTALRWHRWSVIDIGGVCRNSTGANIACNFLDMTNVCKAPWNKTRIELTWLCICVSRPTGQGLMPWLKSYEKLCFLHFNGKNNATSRYREPSGA